MEPASPGVARPPAPSAPQPLSKAPPGPPGRPRLRPSCSALPAGPRILGSAAVAGSARSPGAAESAPAAGHVAAPCHVTPGGGRPPAAQARARILWQARPEAGAGSRKRESPRPGLTSLERAGTRRLLPRMAAGRAPPPAGPLRPLLIGTRVCAPRPALKAPAEGLDTQAEQAKSPGS